MRVRFVAFAITHLVGDAKTRLDLMSETEPQKIACIPVRFVYGCATLQHDRRAASAAIHVL